MAKKRKALRNQALIGGLAAAAVVLLGLMVWLVVRLVGIYNTDTAGTTVRVPDLIGLSEAQAQAQLRDAQLDGHHAPDAYNDDVPKGHVHEQDPAAGKFVRPGREVRYSLSLGKASFTVPDLRGKTPDEAGELLRKNGLVLGAVQRIVDRSHPAGKIINQSPRLGEEFTSPVSVDVVIADVRDLPQVTMPDLHGLQLRAAEELLTRADMNLQLAVVEYAEDNTSAPGTVLAQQPGAGELTDMGSRVELQVAVPSDVKANPNKRLTLRIPVPTGAPDQQVTIKVADELGERIDYREMKKPGDIVERTVDVAGSAVVRIFVGDEKTPVREERI